MKNEDARLVHRFLTGDEDAFNTLVKKYQKNVHALAWRKVGDFHIAEELTQDTFLKAYAKLATLKNPRRFAGWLYVIANRLCIAWHRKQKPPMESLETTSGDEIAESSYRHYEDKQREEASVEYRRGRVKNLLEKLPESERTVMTLHYLGEMTSKAISEFLGVSPNTVKSRLQRARNRLKEQEDMIRETLGSVHLPTTFTENIMRRVTDIKPAAPTSSRPLIPVALSAATAIFIFLIMGVGSQHLARFQKPYNLNAQSETTVEIIDAPIVLDTKAKPDLRNQAGRFDTTGKSKGAGPQVSEPVMLAAAQVEKETRQSTKQQWIQTSGPEKTGSASGLLVSSWGDVYVASSIGIYKLAPDGAAWMFVSSLGTPDSPKTSVNYHGTPMTERNDLMYLVSPDGVFASKDRGETGVKLGKRPKGNAVGLAVTGDGLYLALQNQGVFRSTDEGKQWTLLNNEEAGKNVLAIAAVENSVFVGTTRGLYRLHSETWKKLPIDTTKAVHSLSVSGDNLYVGTGPNYSQLEDSEERMAYIGQLMGNADAKAWEVFHSTDGGESWTEITPVSTSPMMKASPGVKVLATGKSILALGIVSFRSTDGGKTWTEFGFDFNEFDMDSMMHAMTLSMFPAVAVDENTLLKAGAFGVSRSTDSGASWHSFTKGIVGTKIFNLVEFNNELYTSTTTGVAKSNDGGESWKNIPTSSGELTLKPAEKSSFRNLLLLPKLTTADGTLYGVASTLALENKFLIFRLSASGNVLVPIQETPVLDKDASIKELADIDVTDQLNKFPGAFAVSGETFYVEHKRRLLRWTRGASEWFNTGLVDTGESTDESEGFIEGFKLAVSQETVYVGKRDGSLFQSFDRGNTWKDLTSNLPLRFERFNAITFADGTVYVATDVGVLTSTDGEHWGVITDTEGTYAVMDQITTDATTVYGAGSNGIYQLNDRAEWKQISPEVPDTVTSFVINGERFYIGTENRGMFYVSLEKAW